MSKSENKSLGLVYMFVFSDAKTVRKSPAINQMVALG